MSCVICWCFVEFVTLREPTANQTAPCWGSARCRRCSSALCLRSSAASRSGWPALRTDCWKANTHQQVRLQSALSTSCHCFPPSSPCTVQQNLFLSPMSVKAHIQTEAYLESDVPETKAQWILNFRIWYKINICREKCHLIYNYRIFQFNLIFNVFIINDRQKKKKKKTLFRTFYPHMLVPIGSAWGFLVPCLWQEPASFCPHMSSSVFTTISAPRLATVLGAKSNTLHKPQAPELWSLLRLVA